MRRALKDQPLGGGQTRVGLPMLSLDQPAVAYKPDQEPSLERHGCAFQGSCHVEDIFTRRGQYRASSRQSPAGSRTCPGNSGENIRKSLETIVSVAYAHQESCSGSCPRAA